jgi:hypothetical protein
MRLLHDNEPEGSDDCECTFFWMNVDRAPQEWVRLSDFAIGTPFDPLPMQDFGAGEEVNFRWLAIISGQTSMVVSTEGPAFGVSVPDGKPFIIRANGYDGGYGEGSRDPTQDCLDEHVGHHHFAAHVDLDLDSFPDTCYAGLVINPSGPDQDPFPDLQATFSPENGYGVGQQTLRSESRGCVATVQRPGDPLISQLPVPCDPQQQQEALQALKDAGVTVLQVDTLPHAYELVVLIEEHFPLPPPPPGPDLSASNIRCGSDTLVFGIGNGGDTAAGAFSTEVVFSLTDGGQRVASTVVGPSSLAVGAVIDETTLVPTQCLQLGGCDVSIEVDIDDEVEESDETNNTASGSGCGLTSPPPPPPPPPQPGTCRCTCVGALDRESTVTFHVDDVAQCQDGVECSTSDFDGECKDAEVID